MCPESTLTAWRGLVFQQLGAEIRVPPGARAASRGGSGAHGSGHSLPDRFLFIPHIQTKERGHRVSSPAEPDKRSSLTELRWLSVSALGAMKCKKDQLLMTTMVENSAWGGGGKVTQPVWTPAFSRAHLVNFAPLLTTASLESSLLGLYLSKSYLPWDCQGLTSATYGT